MFTYGYLREAVLAHLDIDETEAQSMKILERLHIFANEAMQAICASKPMYQYLDITVVEDYAPLVMSGAFLRPATADEIKVHDDWEGDPSSNPIQYVSIEITKDYYNKQNIYKQFETIKMSDTFINFANKQCYKITVKKPTIEELFASAAFNFEGKMKKEIVCKSLAEVDLDFSYISKNQIKFYRTGRYLIPAKYLWFRFDSGIADEAEIDMPSDIFMCIPLYISSVCLQIDNIQKANILRNEFEIALARCTSGDFMTLNEFKADW